MNLYHSELWLSDLDETISVLPELEELTGKSVMVTGCTGLICSAVTDVLIRWNETHENKIGIAAAGRDFAKMEGRFGDFARKDWFRKVFYDAASDAPAPDVPCDYIIHGAGNAFPAMIMKEPVETMLGNFTGLKRLLDYARERRAKRVLYLSSSEVYGIKTEDRPYQEGDYGYIDLLNPRNSYSVGKRAAETLCAAYAAEYGADSVIARPGHIYGPTASPLDNRVSSAWTWAATRGEPIVMKSDGAQMRSYCYCLDCASAILKILLTGESVRAYNISNPDSVISIREMAELLAEFAGVELKREAATEQEKKGFNPMGNSSLNAESLLSLGWKGLFDAERGFSHTVSILREALGTP